MKYLLNAMAIAIALASPASAMGDYLCPTHEAPMIFTGKTKFERTTQYELYRCTYGDTWWFPAQVSFNQPQVIQKQDRARWGNPVTPSYVQYPCPICGQNTIYSGSEFVDYKLKKLRRCLNNHTSIWDD